MWIVITVLLFGTVVDLKAQSTLSPLDREEMLREIKLIDSFFLEEKRKFLDSIVNGSFCSVQSPETAVIQTTNSSDFQLNETLKCQEKMPRLRNHYDVFLNINASYFEACFNKLENASISEHRAVLDQLLKHPENYSLEQFKTEHGDHFFIDHEMEKNCQKEGPINANNFMSKVLKITNETRAEEQLPDEIQKQQQTASSTTVHKYSQTFSPEENEKAEANAFPKSTPPVLEVLLEQNLTVKFTLITRTKK